MIALVSKNEFGVVSEKGSGVGRVTPKLVTTNANPLIPNPSPPKTGEKGVKNAVFPNPSPPRTGEKGVKDEGCTNAFASMASILREARVCQTLLFMLSLFIGEMRVWAQSLQFDTNPSVACRELVDSEFTQSVPDEKLIVVDCQVSVLGLGGRSALDECLFHFYSPELFARVHDFSPKTLVSTDVVGNIQIEHEGVQSHGVHVGANGDGSGILTAQISANQEQRSEENRSHEILPPREVVTAAGTLGRGTGVYFKIRRTTQQSLEGTHCFSLILRVPAGWRAGYLRLHCQAFSARTRLQDPQMMAQSAFMIPLYLKGDAEAKQQAMRLMAAEQSLIAMVRERGDVLQKASRPSIWYDVALKAPKVPDQWLVTLLRQSADTATQPYERYLPTEIQEHIAVLRSEKMKMLNFSLGTL